MKITVGRLYQNEKGIFEVISYNGDKYVIHFKTYQSSCSYNDTGYKSGMPKMKGLDSYDRFGEGYVKRTKIKNALKYTKLAQKLYPNYVKYTVEKKDYLIPKNIVDTMNK